MCVLCVCVCVCVLGEQKCTLAHEKFERSTGEHLTSSGTRTHDLRVTRQSSVCVCVCVSFRYFSIIGLIFISNLIFQTSSV